MIVASRKSLDEILGLLGSCKKVLVLGCGGCTSICLAGGQREVRDLCAELDARVRDHGGGLTLHELTIERQCNETFFADADALVKDYEAVLSTACGAGVQFVAERHPALPVLPALNTAFVGFDKGVGWYEENCRTCGDCVLGETGGICPVTRCAKSLFNGPCGGTRSEGTCEVDKTVPCAWFEIHKRLKGQGRLALITKVRPAREWENQTRRSVIQEPYKARYAKP
ncbi:MAG: methylenetetrahydrofolate reductase C-terminal domain-containing protein [Deltaproteobacteria bacterium]|nr:methylenetetrahydrofolate reductase C-terminal domain-containing protein [Deltaproteobacteria bacterium]